MIDKERWERIDSVYHAALERDVDDRSAFLDEVCDGDEVLRTEVDSLLEFDEPATRFIETPAIELEAKEVAADQAAQSEEMLLTEIGPYRLESIISHGSMGDVFLAIDTRLDRKVAIKVLSKEFTDQERISRFKQEARTTSTLSHVNIVTLFEVGEVEGHHYIVTEYVEGETLRQRLNRSSAKQLSVEETLKIISQVLDALQAAHQAGVIHRDIKPENVVLRSDGLVKVLDFGIAKLTAKESESSSDRLTTKTGIIMGTASYMSPEQARGQKVDHRADIFSVGAMLYEMLSGKRPFEGETMADVMAAVLVKDPKPLDQLVSDLPTSLQRVVQRCLEKAPDKRFQTASDLTFSLHEVSASVAKARASASRVDGLSQRSLIGRTGIGALVVVLLFAIIIFVVANKDTRQPEGQQTVAAKQPRVAEQPRAAAKDTTTLVWFDRAGNTLGTIGAPGKYSGPALSPTEDRVVVSLEDPATKRDIWVFPVGTGDGVRLTTDPSDDLNPVWSPDGQWIIYTSERSGVRSVYRKRADGTGPSEPVLETSETKNVEDVSPDGSVLILNTGNRDEVQPRLSTFVFSDKTLRTFRVTSVREDSGRFSPDGRWIAFRSYETSQSEIFITGITARNVGSSQKWMVSNGRGGNTQPLWRGDGKELYYLDHKTLMTVSVTDTGSGLVVGSPTPLFKAEIEDTERRNRFTVTKDGQRFLFIVRAEERIPAALTQN